MRLTKEQVGEIKSATEKKVALHAVQLSAYGQAAPVGDAQTMLDLIADREEMEREIATHDAERHKWLTYQQSQAKKQYESIEKLEAEIAELKARGNETTSRM